ncbi:MAG: sulfotransferase [Pseudomonadota bacterium]
MSNIFIHIGFPKTATTTLQTVMMDHAACAYLGKGLRDTMEPSLSLDIAGAVFFSDTLRFADRAPALRDRIAAEAEGASCLMLSDEAFSFAEYMQIGTQWGCKTVTDHVVIADRIAALCPEAHVLMSTRNQLSFLQSFFRQTAKRRHAQERPFESFVDEMLAVLPHRSMLHALRYDEALRAYQGRFGADRVMVTPYESYSGDFGPYLTSVAQFCGLDPEAVALSWGGIHANKAHGSRERPGLRRARGLVPAPVRNLVPKALRKRVSAAAALPPLQATFTPAHKDSLTAFFAPSNAALTQQTGLDLAQWSYPLP